MSLQIILASLALAVPVQEMPRLPHEMRLERGRTALEAGRGGEAVMHLENALRWRPASEEILVLLIRANQGNPDLAGLWAHMLATAAVKPDGYLGLERKSRAAINSVAPAAASLAKARAVAVKELANLARASKKRAKRVPSQILKTWWAAGAAHALFGAAPVLREAYAPDLDWGFRTPPSLPSNVVLNLSKVMKGALRGARGDEATRAARILNGLGTQAGFDELQGEPYPDAKDLAELGADGLAHARTIILTSGACKEWTFEDLNNLNDEEAVAFTRSHDSFGNPAVALSPRRWYRIETTCGFETTLGVAATVEDHHLRLANWFGEDPFGEQQEKRQGVVRIVPDFAGLESEGCPYWWNDGFQRGDLTVLEFDCGTIEGLGHNLTHELTHRFDNAIYPGLPGWLLEGRAVWTADSYAGSQDDEFISDCVKFRKVERAFIKGYGKSFGLKSLITGTNYYRDNYFAGYALYVYLNTWEENGRLLFADQLEPYMHAVAKDHDDPLVLFVEHFADGAAGRPTGFTAFTEEFDTFLRGFYWDSIAPWTSRYTRYTSIERTSSPLVYDEPTWTWQRYREAPGYGQDHAYSAARLFLELGREREAAEAFVWALGVDERSPLRNREMGSLFDNLGQQGAAWSLRNENERLSRRAGDNGGEPCPFSEDLKHTRAFLRELEVASRAAAEREAEVTSRSLAGEHNRLAAMLGLPLLDIGAQEDWAPESPSIERAARVVPIGDWVEDDLTNYEERRIPNLWYPEADGDLHVGRGRPREHSGTVERASSDRQAFTRTTEWQHAGCYTVRGRIKFTTSYARAALVLGYTRRDRNVRLHFHAGDWEYSAGKKEEQREIDSVSWRVDGLRIRDGLLDNSTPGGWVEFPTPQHYFLLEARVDGPAVHVWIEGEHIGSYHTVDGQPIEGYVGFATSFGAIQVMEPTVQRLDRSAFLGHVAEEADSELMGLDLDRLVDLGFDMLTNRTVRGLPSSLNGTVLLWVPVIPVAKGEEQNLEATFDFARDYAELVFSMLDTVLVSQPLVLALPDLSDRADREALEAELRGEFGERVSVVPFAERGRSFDTTERTPGYRQPWLCFVDSANTLRVAERIDGDVTDAPHTWGFTCASCSAHYKRHRTSCGVCGKNLSTTPEALPAGDQQGWAVNLPTGTLPWLKAFSEHRGGH